MSFGIQLPILKNGNQTKNPCLPIFARHETFHPRFGWLKKGFDAVNNDPLVFLNEDAPVILGVGVNMVKAIRYWCCAFKIIEEIREPKSQKVKFSSTAIGNYIFSDQGWDPYLESPSTLWLLHWLLLRPLCQVPAWYFTFNIFQKPHFSNEDILLELLRYKDNLFQNLKVVESSVRKDINCLLRMYVENHKEKSLLEDSINSPFIQLGLLSRYGDSKHYLFQYSPKRHLPPEIIVYACLDCLEWLAVGKEKTISISRLLYESGSPGLVFKLTESELCNAINIVSKSHSEIGLSDTAGLVQFQIHLDRSAIDLFKMKLLETLYHQNI